MLPRKASTRGSSRPYPKPTQVVRQRILRRSRESWLRNSAKCPRNFGRRGARNVNTLAVGSVEWPQRPVGSDCLLKTQVRAKSQDDVYGLTPARWGKVKRTGEPQGEAENLSPSKRRW